MTFLPALTLFHIALSLVGIATGFVVVADLMGNRLQKSWTGWFLTTTLATSLTGFLFPIHGFTPALAFGVISTIVLGLAIYALHARRLAGPWRKTYAISSVIAQYLNFFVLVAQLFQKVPALRELAPTQNAPAFGITQAIVLAVFIRMGFVAVKKFHPAAPI